MRLTCLAIASLCLALTACGRDEAAAPNAAPPPDLTKRDEATFTLYCQGNYSLTIGDEARVGGQNFRLTVDARNGRAYMSGLWVNNWHHGPMAEMNQEIRPITRITADEIITGVLRIDRNTGKYTAGPTTTGTCSRQPEVVPIPVGRI